MGGGGAGNEIDRLLDRHAPQAIADLLNTREMVSGAGKPLHKAIAQHLICCHGLTDRYARAREHGMLTAHELAAAAGIHDTTVASWRQAGLLEPVIYNVRVAVWQETSSIEEDELWAKLYAS